MGVGSDQSPNLLALAQPSMLFHSSHSPVKNQSQSHHLGTNSDSAIYLSLEMELSMYHPVTRAEEIERVVCRGEAKKYRRFRPARFYGGIATADCVGCCLRCLFCWSWENVVHPEKYGSFWSPEEVAAKLIGIARAKGYRQMRVSGNEPTIGRDHLLRLLSLIPNNFRFILETNGILIGFEPSYAQDLARFKNLHVRVSLKATSAEDFTRLTGADPIGFELQIQAVENLFRAGVSVHPAVMVSFSQVEDVQNLMDRLAGLDKAFRDIEIEELVFWGGVEERLQKAKVKFLSAYSPDRIPPEQT